MDAQAGANTPGWLHHPATRFEQASTDVLEKKMTDQAAKSGSISVPKTFDAEQVSWSYRHGVIAGMRARGRGLPNQGHAYVIAPSNMLRLADRVQREYMRRHPKTDSAPREEHR